SRKGSGSDTSPQRTAWPTRTGCSPSCLSSAAKGQLRVSSFLPTLSPPRQVLALPGLVRAHEAGLDSGLVSLVAGLGVGPQQAVYQELGIVPVPLLGREQPPGESLLEPGQKRLQTEREKLKALRLDVGIGAPHGRIQQVRRNPHGGR